MFLHRGLSALAVLLILALIAPLAGLHAQDDPVDVDSEVKSMIRRMDKADDGTF
jgi:hypothetical protein